MRIAWMGQGADMVSEPSPRVWLESISWDRQAALLHHVEPAGVRWATRHRQVLRADPEGPWEIAAVFPFAAPRDFFGFSRPTARAMRADKANIYVNRQGRVLGVRAGIVYRLGQEAGLEPLFSIQGDSVLHGGICEDRNGWVFLGEYFMNPARGPVRIWRIAPDMDSYEIAHEFGPGEVRHIHGIYRDPYDEEALWATVGDYEGECYLYRSQDGFRTLERFGDGSQRYRAVRLYFTPDAVTWLTDSQMEQNHACRMRRSNGNLEIGQPLEAPTWYGATTREGLHLAFTTVEPGPAVRRNSAAILGSWDGFQWQEIHSFKKDAWRPMKLFKYGVISCPSGELSARSFPISGEGLRGLDGVSATLHLSWEAR